MLGILICYASFHHFAELQKQNIAKFVKCPYKLYIIHSYLTNNPSAGHMANLNALLDGAWDECDSFLFLDNDMIFLNDFHEPEEDCWYMPQTRSGFTYAWPNLMYFKKHALMRRIGFENGSDSGGSTWRYLAECNSKREITIDDGGLPDFQRDFKALCEHYNVPYWVERYILNRCEIFHFRAMSNWTKYPLEYCQQKEVLVMDATRNVNQYTPRLPWEQSHTSSQTPPQTADEGLTNTGANSHG